MTTLEKATSLLTGDDPGHAGARTIIKRTLAKMKLPASGTVEELAGFFVAHPWACTRAIENRIEESAKAWIDGNNSGDPRILDRLNHKSSMIASHVETLMALIGVTLDWPGLYPTYEYKGYSHHDLSGLWQVLRAERKA